MALISLQNAVITVGGTDISDHVSSVELSIEADELDSTVFGTSGFKGTLSGLKSGSLKLGIKGDYAASNIDSLLWTWFTSGANQAFTVKATNAAVGTSNPLYSGQVCVNSISPVAGAVGDLVEFDLTWPTSGVITRATA
jgi:hypothetical protein